ncbi:hypothetical protein HK101_007467 [Irineochytrium annulatum]|nr:hypothetical protein HK101_007467 [Irineochytrium annulatum]
MPIHIPDDVVRLIMDRLDPIDILDRRALIACIRASGSLLPHAAAVLWSTAELHVDGSVRRKDIGRGASERDLNIDGTIRRRPSVFAEPPRPVTMVDGVALGVSVADRGRRKHGGGGGNGRAAWRWRAYLNAVRRLIVVLHSSSAWTAGGAMDAAVMGPWLRRLDEIVVDTGDDMAPANGWATWLTGRWADGEVPDTLKLVDTSLTMAQELASHRVVTKLWLEVRRGYKPYYLRELFSSIGHGLEAIQIGSGGDGRLRGRSTAKGAVRCLETYAHSHQATLRRVDLYTHTLLPISENVPMVYIDQQTDHIDLENSEVVLHKKTLRALALTAIPIPDRFNNLAELQNVEVLAVATIESDNGLLANEVARMASLRHLHLHIKDVRGSSRMLISLRHLVGLELLDLRITTKQDVNFDELIKALPRLDTLILSVIPWRYLGNCTVTFSTNLKCLKLANVKLIVDREALIPGVVNLEHLTMAKTEDYGSSALVVDLVGGDFEKRFALLLQKKNIAPRFQQLKIPKSREFSILKS